jgi:tripartite-type tricarboxylate transporter receptor subunit TctC
MKHLLRLLTLALVLGAAPAAAQDYPNKPIRLIVPYAPGGSSDVIGRLLGEKLRVSMGQPVVVENRPGAGSMIGHEAAAKSPADGYTLVLSDTPVAINPSVYAKVPYDPVKDFAAVTLVGKSQLFLFVNAASPIKTLKEFVAQAKAEPGKVSIGSGGNGSTPHLMIGMLRALTGVDYSHVPYKGSGPAVADVAAGQITGVFSTIATAKPLLSASKLRAIVGSGTARNMALPDVPTFAEAGVPGIVVEQWWGILAPAGTPAPVVAKLNGELLKALRAPDTVERFAGLAVDPATSSADEFQKFLAAEVQKWGKAAKDAGVTPAN